MLYVSSQFIEWIIIAQCMDGPWGYQAYSFRDDAPRFDDGLTGDSISFR